MHARQAARRIEILQDKEDACYLLLLGLGPAEEDFSEVQDEAAGVERSAVGKWRVAAAVAAAGNASFVVV